MVYLSSYLTPHTETFGDIGLLRSVFRACMGRNVQLLFIAGPAGAEGTTGGCDDDRCVEPKPVQMTLDRFDTCDSGIRLAIGICCGGGLA